MFSFVQRLPTDLGRTFIAARQGQASNKAKHYRSVTNAAGSPIGAAVSYPSLSGRGVPAISF